MIYAVPRGYERSAGIRKRKWKQILNFKLEVTFIICFYKGWKDNVLFSGQ